MAVINRIASYADEMTTWRRQLHRQPELGFDCQKTSDFIAARLAEFGISDIHRGVAKTGIVAVIKGQGPGATIGLRADMDALPIVEETGADYASEVPGKMHACGHDGHMVMLLGAAQYLSETKRFSGRVALIFQPAEEDGGGAEVMCQDGLMERFNISKVYGLHNGPNLPEGVFETSPGPFMAAVDSFAIDIKGQGGHGGYPNETRDPVTAALAIGQALQTISSRNHVPEEDLVVSLTVMKCGDADNVIPQDAFLAGTVRSFDPNVQDMVETRLTQICTHLGQSYGVEAKLTYTRFYPATVNHVDETELAAEAARDVVGADKVNCRATRRMFAEDFAYMLEKRPGAYLFLGQGDGPPLHHPAYDFNDRIAPIGASFFVRLVERVLPYSA